MQLFFLLSSEVNWAVIICFLLSKSAFEIQSQKITYLKSRKIFIRRKKNIAKRQLFVSSRRIHSLFCFVVVLKQTLKLVSIWMQYCRFTWRLFDRHILIDIDKNGHLQVCRRGHLDFKKVSKCLKLNSCLFFHLSQVDAVQVRFTSRCNTSMIDCWYIDCIGIMIFVAAYHQTGLDTR